MVNSKFCEQWKLHRSAGVMYSPSWWIYRAQWYSICEHNTPSSISNDVGTAVTNYRMWKFVSIVVQFYSFAFLWTVKCRVLSFVKFRILTQLTWIQFAWSLILWIHQVHSISKSLLIFLLAKYKCYYCSIQITTQQKSHSLLCTISNWIETNHWQQTTDTIHRWSTFVNKNKSNIENLVWLND